MISLNLLLIIHLLSKIALVNVLSPNVLANECRKRKREGKREGKKVGGLFTPPFPALPPPGSSSIL